MPDLVLLVRRKMLIGAIVAFVVGAALIVRSLAPGSLPPAEPPAEPAPLEEVRADPLEVEAAEAPADPPVIVYVSGAVQAPDVYRLPAESRVKDLVLAAGGFAADADPEHINLAAPLADGQHVNVPRLGAPAQQDAPEAAAAGGAVNINTADASALEGLPGIGPALAERIVAHRADNGPFSSVEDLRQVKGIGASLFEKIAPLVSVGP